jgi:hypothetical protein
MDHKTRIRTSPKYFHSRRNILYLDAANEFVRICTRDVNEQAAEANKLVATFNIIRPSATVLYRFFILPLRRRTCLFSAGAIFSTQLSARLEQLNPQTQRNVETTDLLSTCVFDIQPSFDFRFLWSLPVSSTSSFLPYGSGTASTVTPCRCQECRGGAVNEYSLIHLYLASITETCIDSLS